MPLYGTQESFKSFLAIDIGFHVATGRGWYGRAVIQGDVVYVTAEDPLGHRRRRRGWGLDKGCLSDDIPFRVIEAKPFFGATRGDGDVNEIASQLRDEGLRPRFIIIDTLNQTFDGADEDGPGMQAFMSNANQLAMTFNCVVIPDPRESAPSLT